MPWTAEKRTPTHHLDMPAFTPGPLQLMSAVLVVACLAGSEMAFVLGDSGHSVRRVLETGRTEHAISVGSTQRRFVVHAREGARAGSVLLLLHGSTRHSPPADELAPVRFLENDISAQTKLWADRGALLVFLAGREVGSGHFCWGAGTDNNLCTAPREGMEDESFVLGVLDWLRQHNASFGTAAAPFFLYGHSGGGRMAWRLACNATIGECKSEVLAASVCVHQNRPPAAHLRGAKTNRRTKNLALRAFTPWTGPRLAGAFITSALLPAELRGSSPTCNTATMPPIITTHGKLDTTTPIKYADESVAWAAASAQCGTSNVAAEVGADPVADLVHHHACAGARPDFKIAYYALLEYPHKVPGVSWYGVGWDFLRFAVGPGIPGYENVTPTASSASFAGRGGMSLSASVGIGWRWSGFLPQAVSLGLACVTLLRSMRA